MKFENTFTVQAPPDEVLATLLDVERVAPCMPGAEVLERVDENAYKVGIKVRVGPISMTYRGEVQITERDETARTATMHATAKEARGQGTADARVQMVLTEENGGTRASLDTEVALSGRVAAMGQGVIADVAGKLVETFAENLAAMLAPAAPAAPAPGPQQGSTAIPVAAAAAPPTPAPAVPHSSLPVGKIAATVIAGRLANPRTLLLASLGYAIVFLAIGFLIGRLA
jgi:carbon monoxide dehydrogenase subunit G